MSQEIEVAGNHEQFLMKQVDRLQQWCSAGVGAADITRYAMHELRMDQNLRQCTPQSVYLGLMACAVTGLVPGKLRGHSFLVPFNNTVENESGGTIKQREITFIPGYKGYHHMAERAGLHIQAALVHENDKFDYDIGSTRFVTYRPALQGPGKVIGAAAWVELPRGGLKVTWIPIDDLDKIEANAKRIKASPAWNGVGKDEMRRKTAVRRLGKELETGIEFVRANHIEALQDDAENGLTDALDEITEGSASKLLGEAAKERQAFEAPPRPTVQVPAGPPPGVPAAPPAKATGAGKAPAANKSKPIDAQATERPAASASVSSQNQSAPPAQASTLQAAPGGAVSGNPTSSPSGASNGGSASASASAPSPAATSSASSPAATLSTASAQAPTPTPSGAAAPAGQSQPSPEDQGQSAEPSAGDAFDLAFGDEPAAEPVKNMAAFAAWVAGCKTEQELSQGRGEWISWAQSQGWSIGGPGQPPRSSEITEMQKLFVAKTAELKAAKGAK